MMTGLNPRDCVAAVRLSMRNDTASCSRHLPEDYTILNTSERVLRFIMSTAHRHTQWAGLLTASTPFNPQPDPTI